MPGKLVCVYLVRILGSPAHGTRRLNWSHVAEDSNDLSLQCVESPLLCGLLDFVRLRSKYLA
jgi:hypothetical protein